ncbi:MAG: DUF4214 domain-containing protein [Campylobacterota bacterium]|nr:DUF4214 domain-containing protein [Campylobacterota bacterium]
MASLINGLGGESGFGENSVSRNDDGYSSPIDITSIFEGGIDLFGTTYTSMYVNTNGNITFNGGLSSYTPGEINAGSNPIFAPYWADVDTRAGVVTASTGLTSSVDYSLNAYRDYLNDNDTYYNTLNITSVLSNHDISMYNLSSESEFIQSAFEVTGLNEATINSIDITSYYTFLSNAQADLLEEAGDSNYNTSGNSTGSNLVWWDLDTDSETITVTWDDVGYFSRQMDKTNAFQLQLHNNSGEIEISFIYEDINWTTGSESGGTNGLGGIVARAGYSAGDGEHYFELPFSGDQASMINLDNLNTSGMLNFSLSDGNIDGIGSNISSDILDGTISSDYLSGMGGDDRLDGGLGDDTLDGGFGDDWLDGGDGSDIFHTGDGTDTVYGGDGTDFVIYSDNLNSYDFDNMSDYFNVINDDNTSEDNLYDVEYITFGDSTISQDEIMELISLEESVARLYNALLGRNPDNDGLMYWLNDVNSNDNSIQGISGAFAGSEEYLARFGAQSNEAFINQLYNNILQRDADQAGYDYWMDDIENTGDRTGMIVSFSESQEYISGMSDEIDAYLESINLSEYTTEVIYPDISIA